MSADASARVREELDLIEAYDEKESYLEDLMIEAHRKCTSGRVTDEEKERVRQGWFRVYKDLFAEWRKMREQRDLEELGRRIEQLETVRTDGGRP